MSDTPLTFFEFLQSAEQLQQLAAERAGDISGYPDIESVYPISQPLADLYSALGQYSLDPDTDCRELSVSDLYQKYSDIAIAIGLRDNPD